MKIIEALKEFPLIQKKIDKKVALIEKYSAELDNGSQSFAFGTEEAQKQEVKSLIQSVDDLVIYESKLRQRLALTNASTLVTIGEQKASITEWIALREKGLYNKIKATTALNDQKARTEISRTSFDPETGIKIVRFYDEKKKNERYDLLTTVQASIDSVLEMVNATTDLVD